MTKHKAALRTSDSTAASGDATSVAASGEAMAEEVGIVVALPRPVPVEPTPIRKPRRVSKAKAHAVEVRENFPRFVEDYLQHLWDKSPDTRATYKQSLDDFARWMRENELALHVEAITRDMCRRYLTELGEVRNLSRGTVRTRHANLRAFFNWLIEEGELDASPMARIKAPEEKPRPTPVLSEEEFRRILAACSGNDFNARRDTAMIRLLRATGIRRGELVSMRYPDSLDLAAGLVRVSGKTGTGEVPFGPPTATALRRYLRARDDHDCRELPNFWLTQRGAMTRNAAYHIVEARARQAGLDAWTHLFRHTWAHRAKEAGMSTEDLMDMGRWSSEAMVRRYGRSEAHKRAIEHYRRLGLDDE